MDECEVNNGGCSQFATCINVPGSFKCACNTGFTGDGFTCAGETFISSVNRFYLSYFTCSTLFILNFFRRRLRRCFTGVWPWIIVRFDFDLTLSNTAELNSFLNIYIIAKHQRNFTNTELLSVTSIYFLWYGLVYVLWRRCGWVCCE